MQWAVTQGNDAAKRPLRCSGFGSGRVGVRAHPTSSKSRLRRTTIRDKTAAIPPWRTRDAAAEKPSMVHIGGRRPEPMGQAQHSSTAACQIPCLVWTVPDASWGGPSDECCVAAAPSLGPGCRGAQGRVLSTSVGVERGGIMQSHHRCSGPEMESALGYCERVLSVLLMPSRDGRRSELGQPALLSGLNTGMPTRSQRYGC